MASYEQSPQDEGYSEDPLTVGGPGSMGSPLWLKNMPAAERTEFVMSIIDGLPTSEVCEIVRRLRPRLYIDFFQYLPAEVCLKILGFLDPVSLINTARASRDWMVLSLDRRLWEELYILEGFRVIRSEVRKFEECLNTGRSTSGQLFGDEHASKKRATPQRIKQESDGDLEMMDVESYPVHKQVSIFGPSTGASQPKRSRSRTDTKMEYEENLPSIRGTKVAQYTSRPVAQSPLQDHISRRLSSTSIYASHYQALLSSMSSMVVLDRRDQKMKLNWQHLFSQRRRLEANWETAKYTNFQLPHPNYPEEAHVECIYTIQYTGKYLVSGSRDRTLRIWDLDTRRLVRPPLRAHVGSVLCLQFDADPEEDLIVSGSSDATVVLWRFSTGEIIQRWKAHRESVLNVRFDKRVLVTCSKDKTIKIFNRKAMAPGDYGYPQVVNPIPTVLNNYGFHISPTNELSIKPPYSLIGCLEGHGAAVNAVQIFGDEIVSASGDRTVKVWNWVDQSCTRTFVGHTKGIACVQYDGRRIVSGSSDNEVKVFDKESGLELASLRGHSNLVRTVQAGFGDLPYSEEEDKEDAKMVDEEYFKTVDAGTVTQGVRVDRRRPRNAGSRNPEHITAYGAKLPPGGGGGGKFARIVSGSYDETIIIWRRDKDGAWKAEHILRQEDAAHIASRNIKQRRHHHESTSGGQASHSGSQQASHQGAEADDQEVPFAPGSASFYHHLIDITLPKGPVALRHAFQAHPQILMYLEHLSDATDNLPQAGRQAMNLVVQNAISAQQLQQLDATGNLPTTSSNDDSASGATAAGQQATSTSSPVTSVTATGPSSSQTIQPPVQAQATAPATAAPQAQSHAPHHHLSSNMARVFKLQFDARRIICCSQTSIIVGWDFANNDEQIIQASRFFAPVE